MTGTEDTQASGVEPTPRPLVVVLAVIPFVVVLASLGLVLATSVPLGVQDEWFWRRYSTIDLPVFELVAGFVAFAAAAALAFAADHRRDLGPAARRTAVALVLALGALVDFQVLLAGKIGLVENLYAVLDRYTTGYLAEAAEISDGREFFSDFHHHLKTTHGPVVHHLDVHPPANIAFSYFVLRLCQRSPRLTSWLVTDASKDVAMAVRMGREHQFFDRLPDDPALYAAAYLIVLLFVASLSAARLLLLVTGARLAKSPRNLGLAACALVALPSPILFLGHFDVLFFFWTSVCLALFVSSRSGARRRRILFSAAAGFACGIGVTFTLGYGVVLAFVIVFLLTRVAREREAWTDLFAFLAGGGVVIVLCYVCGVRIVEICFACLDNNSKFYLQTFRSGRWILVNPIELIAFSGGVWAALMLYGLRRCSPRGLFAKTDAEATRFFAWVFLLYLLVHPYCRGEFPRLTLLYLPIPIGLCVHDLLTEVRDRRAWLLVAAGTAAALLQIFLIRASLKIAFFYGNV